MDQQSDSIRREQIGFIKIGLLNFSLTCSIENSLVCFFFYSILLLVFTFFVSWWAVL